jgi:hypothetical protein
MIPRFSIVTSRDPVQTAEWILGLTEDDPHVLRLDRGPFGASIVFCPTPRVARAQAMRFERARGISAGLCAITLVPGGPIAVDGGGSDDSSERLQRLLSRILPELTPWRVVDDDTGLDLTAAVTRSPAFLFTSS